jgi:hypothetical protein
MCDEQRYFKKIGQEAQLLIPNDNAGRGNI